MLYVIGVGICEGHLTKRAIELIKDANVVYGSSRALKLAKEFITCKKKLMKYNDNEYKKIEKESETKNVVVLSTGDPMVSGLGSKLNGFIEPGISSVQVALAKLNVDLCDVIVVNAHAKKAENLKELLKFRNLLILADKNFDISIFKNRDVCILQNLCMKDEEIICGKAESLKVKSDYSIIFVGR